MKDPIATTSHVGIAALGCPVEQSSTSFRTRTTSGRIKACTQIFFAVIREIFDESAYARFLSQRNMASSRAAYEAFRQENEAVKARHPKCC